ncbi:phosphotransferase [Micromonospora zamorensis]|uniref:phosphotransferase n=1 Tax=Micromonospora zamorensis TaxID=709883 RepID=UPI0037881B02
MDGGTLIHSDLNPANLIVTPLGLRIVDWAWATKAAAWVELALLVPWLIGSGHSAEQAEEWIAQLPAWTAIDRQVLDDFASKNATKWAAKSRQNTERWVRDLAMWTGAWADHRTDGHQSAREPQRGDTLS